MMVKKVSWSVLQDGKVGELVDTKELLEWIQEGKLESFNLICKEGEDHWKCANEFEELKSHFKPVMPKGWVVLRNENGKYIQRGLFSTDELKGFLRQGVVYPRDLVWCAGMVEWRHIYEVDTLRSVMVNEIPRIREWDKLKSGSSKGESLKSSSSKGESLKSRPSKGESLKSRPSKGEFLKSSSSKGESLKSRLSKGESLDELEKSFDELMNLASPGSESVNSDSSELGFQEGEAKGDSDLDRFTNSIVLEPIDGLPVIKEMESNGGRGSLRARALTKRQIEKTYLIFKYHIALSWEITQPPISH